MYCPIDGDEFREGITYCPEHEVDLVEEPPDREEPASWIDRFNDRIAIRLAFLIFLVAALVYAFSGFAAAAIYLMIHLREWKAFETAAVFSEIQSAAFPVAIAALGALAGALLLRGFLVLSGDGGFRSTESSSNGEAPRAGPIPAPIMRLLLALTVLFALLWAGTGIATSREQVEYSSSFAAAAQEEPEESFITLQTLNYVGYTGGVASLAIMGAGLIAKAHERGRSRPRSSS